jgi:hypothetical protein
MRDALISKMGALAPAFLDSGAGGGMLGRRPAKDARKAAKKAAAAAAGKGAGKKKGAGAAAAAAESDSDDDDDDDE